jgi:hypothetical protein
VRGGVAALALTALNEFRSSESKSTELSLRCTQALTALFELSFAIQRK